MPATTSNKKHSFKNQYGDGYAIFCKDNSKVGRRRRIDTPTKKQQQTKLNATTIKKEIARPTSFDDLISELDYSYDSLATINVIFDSLQFTYINSKDDIDQHKNLTRLGDMEKELLAAYDDLCLQINHLEKNIKKMEQKVEKLKTEYSSSDDSEDLSSPSISSSSSPSSIFLETDLNSHVDFSTFLLSSDFDQQPFKQQPVDIVPLSYY